MRKKLVNRLFTMIALLIIFCFILAVIGWLYRPGSATRDSLTEPNNELVAVCDPSGVGYWERTYKVYDGIRYRTDREIIRMTEQEYQEHCANE